MNYCGDKGISAGEISTLKVNKLNISNSKSAVASKDFSTVEIENFSEDILSSFQIAIFFFGIILCFQ